MGRELASLMSGLVNSWPREQGVVLAMKDVVLTTAIAVKMLLSMAAPSSVRRRRRPA